MKTKYIITLVLLAFVLLSFGVISKKSTAIKNSEPQSESGFAMTDRNQF